VAYIVPKEMPGPTVNRLRRFLEEKLPAFMVPSSFVMLETLPLTPNGKIDLKALQDLQPDRPELEAAYVAPRSKLERDIGAIWKKALHIDRVGIHDNFFDLGGHSILLIQIQSKLEELLEQDISMLELFEHPTISTLARYLAQQSSEPSLPRLDERTEELSQGQHRMRQRRQALAGRAEPTYE
jgi:acyl carrier protein